MRTTKALLCALAVLIVANCGGGPTEPSDFEFGRVDVYTRDAAGQPVNGVAVKLERLNGQTEDAGGLSGTLGVAGYFFFLKVSGEYRVVITPPAGYELATGQTASQQIRFERNQTKTLNFVLRVRAQ